MSSALLTPTDLSPTKPFDPKLHSPYELAPSRPYIPQSSLSYEPGSPRRMHDNLSTPHTPYRSPYSQYSYLPTSNAFPFFEPVSEHPPPLPSQQTLYHSSPPAPLAQSLYNSPPPPSRRLDLPRAPLIDWQLPQQPLSHLNSDWLRVDERAAVPQYSSNASAFEEPLRSSFTYNQPPSPQAPQPASSHEVSGTVSSSHSSAYMRFVSFPSPSTFSLSSILRRLLRIIPS